MENTYLAKQHNGNTTAFAFAHLSTQLFEQAFNVAPLNIGAGRSCKDEL
jgi:hypothetical protein